MNDERYENRGRNARDDRWHLRREVSLALIFAVVVQTASIIWWASKTDSRLEAAEDNLVAITEKVGEVADFDTAQRVRIWDRVNENEEIVNQMRRELAGLQAEMKAMNQNIETLVKHFLKPSPPQ